MKLIKLLYLIDRESLNRRGVSISGDRYFAMKHGPVLSSVLDRINEDEEPECVSYWNAAISSPNSAREISLISDPGVGALAESEIALADEIFAKYGHLSRWQIRDLTHQLPEWTWTHESGRQPIDLAAILLALDKPEHQARETQAENCAIDEVHRLLGVR